MGTFLFFVFVIIIIVAISNSSSRKRGPSIKEQPQIIVPIPPATYLDFDTKPFDVYPSEIPVTEDSWLTISKDKNKLKNYGNELDSIRNTSERSARASVVKYESDYAKLNDQRLQIYRRLYHSRKLTSRFRELERQRLNSKDIPDSLRLSLPSRPQGFSSTELTRKYSYSPNIGGAIGRTLSTNGGLSNPNNLYAAAAMAIVAGGVMLVKGKSDNSKMKRVLESGRGDIIAYNMQSKTLVGSLSKFHAEVVVFSNRLKNSEIQLIALISKLNQVPTKVRKLDKVSPEIRKDLQMLHFLTMEAIAYSKTKI